MKSARTDAPNTVSQATSGKRIETLMAITEPLAERCGGVRARARERARVYLARYSSGMNSIESTSDTDMWQSAQNCILAPPLPPVAPNTEPLGMIMV